MFFNGLESILESKDHSHYHVGPAVEGMEHMEDPFSLVYG
jgi:hypothetical protein